MKVPTRVLKAAFNLASNQPVSDEDRELVRDWAKPAIERRASPAPAAEPKEE